VNAGRGSLEVRFGYWQGVWCIAPRPSGLGEQAFHDLTWEISRYTQPATALFTFSAHFTSTEKDTFGTCDEQHV